MHRNILITGGAGFVGSHVALRLKETFGGAAITALDNLSRAGSETNLPLLDQAGIVFRKGDIRSLDDVINAAEPDLIIDCAAEPSALAGYGGSAEYVVQTNVTGTYHCLELARRTRADVLFLSTSRVYPYGLLNGLPTIEDAARFNLAAEQETPGCSANGISEAFPLDGPRSIYGVTKLVSEYLVEEFVDAYGLRFIINRAGLLTGPRQMGKTDQGLIVLWMAAHYWRRPLRYIGFGGEGKQVRDVLDINDFCDLLVDQITHFDAYHGARFNVGGGLANAVSLRELTTLCEDITGNRIEITPDPETRPADVKLYITDNNKVTTLRGWTPKRTLPETLRSIHQWLQAADEATQSILNAGIDA